MTNAKSFISLLVAFSATLLFATSSFAGQTCFSSLAELKAAVKKDPSSIPKVLQNPPLFLTTHSTFVNGGLQVDIGSEGTTITGGYKALGVFTKVKKKVTKVCVVGQRIDMGSYHIQLNGSSVSVGTADGSAVFKKSSSDAYTAAINQSAKTSGKDVKVADAGATGKKQ